MTTPRKVLLVPAAALALGFSFAIPASAGEQEDILVTSSAAMEEWTAGVTRDLDRKLLHAERFRERAVSSGIVQLRFTLDQDGSPTAVKTYYSSANTGAVRTAHSAVKRLRDLDQAPVANASGATFQANIIFADNEEEKARFAKKLEKMERTRLASAGQSTMVITLGS